jgi:hypothetical protein
VNTDDEMESPAAKKFQAKRQLMDLCGLQASAAQERKPGKAICFARPLAPPRSASLSHSEVCAVPRNNHEKMLLPLCKAFWGIRDEVCSRFTKIQRPEGLDGVPRMGIEACR